MGIDIVAFLNVGDDIIHRGFDALLLILDALLTNIVGNGSLHIQVVIGVNPHATLACRQTILREGTLGIAAVKHDTGGLGDDLRCVAYHILHAIHTRIDGYLTDAGGTADNLS